MWSYSRFRFADFSSFESCSASVSARSSSSNCSRTAVSIATLRCFSRICASDIRTWSSLNTSSCVELIEGVPASRTAISSTIDAASRSPCSWMRVQISWPYAPSSRSVVAWSSHFGFPAFVRSSSCASQSLTISRCATSSASRMTFSGTRFAPASTIVKPSFVPTTIRSRSELCSVSSSVGFTTRLPSRRPIRTAPIGPTNGSGDTVSAAETALMARMSCGITRSAEKTVATHCTSFRYPFGHSGRTGRSIMRAVRIARSVGRPSRLKKPPGIFPAAYIRSSTSTVSGKKSAPSRASVRPCAVPSTTVCPLETTTAPSACFASFPVSNRISRPPISTDTETGTPAGCSASTMLISLYSSTVLVKGGDWVNAVVAGARPSSTLQGFPELAAEAELLDEGAVALEILALQVVQEPAAATDQLEQATTRVVVVLVRAQVLGQGVDPLGQHRDLDFGRARVRLVFPELADVLQLLFLGEGHRASPLVEVTQVTAAAKEGRVRPRPGRSVG